MRRRLSVLLYIAVLVVSGCNKTRIDNIITGPSPNPNPGPGPAPVLTNIDYVPHGGTYQVGFVTDAQVTCMDGSGSAMNCPSLTWVSSSTLSVEVTNSGRIRCIAPGASEVSVRTPNGGPAKSYAFTCLPRDGTPVEPPDPEITFVANPTNISSGQSSNLSWTTQYADHCSGSGGWDGEKTLSGSQMVSPSSTAVYNLTCTGPGGTSSKSVTVTVSTGPGPGPGPQPHITVTVVPEYRECYPGAQTTISASVSGTAAGQSTAVNWQSSNTTVASLAIVEPNSVAVDCKQVGSVRITATAVADTTQSDFADVVVKSAPAPLCPSTIDYSPKGGSVAMGQNRALKVDNWPTGQGCKPFWYLDRPSNAQIVGADDTVVIDGKTYYAGENAILRGIFTTSPNQSVLVCVQTSIVTPEVAKCYAWTVTASDSATTQDVVPPLKHMYVTGVSQTYKRDK